MPEKSKMRGEFNWDNVGEDWLPVKVMFPPEGGVSKKTNRAYWKTTLYGVDGEKAETMWLKENTYNLMVFLDFKSGTEFEIADHGRKEKGKWKAKYLIRMNGDDDRVYDPMDNDWEKRDEEPEEEPEQPKRLKKASPPPEFQAKKHHQDVWDGVVDNVMRNWEAWCPQAFEEMSEEVRLKLLVQNTGHFAMMTCCLLNKNGGRK